MVEKRNLNEKVPFKVTANDDYISITFDINSNFQLYFCG